ncbi:MAG TPA: serine/threonine-protein kinase, partial [Archangium sp.]|nr:serine/threonine-protein kinase [Archangium sp.]
MLAEHLRADAAAREASVAWFNSGVSFFFLLCAVGLGPMLGWHRAFAIIGSCAVYAVYYGWISRVLRRGWFHPAICWFNVCLETGAGVWLFAYDILFADAEQALSNPAAVLWSTLIVLAALRSKRLAIFAGCLVATELLLLYFFVALPRLPPTVPVMFSPPLMVQRAVYYFITGGMAAMVAGHITRRAEEALHAIRAKDLLGKYFLHERLGVGGMAEVFRATYSPEGGFEKVVAIKRILPAYSEDEDFVTLFRREAELGSLLNHPNIVQVLDLGRYQGTVFLAMEYVDGMPLSSLLRRMPRKRLPPAAVAYLGAEVAAALAYMHGRTGPKGEPLDVVHRDLNPPNILLSRIGEVKVSDFGIARAANQMALTQAQTVRGKAGYMAPEQAYGRPLDGRADLFALGLTLHELLTGERALQGDSEAELMVASTQQEVLPPSRFVSGISPALDAIIMGLLQHDLEQRTPSGEVL